GITRDARATKMSEAQFAAVIDINLSAAIRLTLALEGRFAAGASVVNLSSRASLGNFGQANYSASKSGLIGFGRALAQRWAPRVRVNAVAPSLVDTPMTQAMPTEVLAKLVARIPAGRIGTPDDVAGIVAFLASPDAAYISGQVIYACGGRTVAPRRPAIPGGPALAPGRGRQPEELFLGAGAGQKNSRVYKIPRAFGDAFGNAAAMT